LWDEGDAIDLEDAVRKGVDDAHGYRRNEVGCWWANVSDGSEFNGDLVDSEESDDDDGDDMSPPVEAEQPATAGADVKTKRVAKASLTDAAQAALATIENDAPFKVMYDALVTLEHAGKDSLFPEIGVAAAAAADALDGMSGDDAREQSLANLRTLIDKTLRVGTTKQAALAKARPDIGGDIQYGVEFAERYGDRLKFLSDSGQWIHWTGARWTERNATVALEQAVKEFAVDKVKHAMSGDQDSDQKKKELKDATAFYSKGNLREAAIKAAESEPAMVAFRTEFDRDPFKIAVGNGVLDLHSGRLAPPSPTQRFLKQAGCDYIPAATAPMFEKFLERVIPDESTRAYLQRAVGYTLTADAGEEKFHILWGTGANGKTTFANIVTDMLGEYVGPVQSGDLVRDQADEQRVCVQLPGARMGLITELKMGCVWNDQLVKKLASKDALSARLLYKEPITFRPTHKLWLITNHLPGVRDSGNGLWRRFAPVKFGFTIPVEERDPTLDKRIIAKELPGVLNWALAGFREWRRGGLNAPKSVTDQLNVYRDSTDIVGSWLRERTLPDDGHAWTLGKIAYADFVAYAKSEGLQKPPIARVFGLDLVDNKGVRRKHSNGAWYGLALRPFEAEEDGAEFGEPDVD
jgi:putative DNA primase/helicase